MGLTVSGFLQNRDPVRSGTADALVLTCIDYRFLDEIPKYLHLEWPGDTFDHVVLAGASLGLFAGVYPNWATTFWDHLDVSLQLHHIKRVIILDHRDCGAYREFHALPPRPPLGTPLFEEYLKQETTIHNHYLKRLAGLIKNAHPQLDVRHDILPVPGE